MPYWKLLGLTCGIAVLSVYISLLSVLVLFKLGFILGENVMAYSFVFIAFGMFVLLAYNFKRGVIISWFGGNLIEKPSRNFYLKFWFEFAVFFLVLLIGIYGVIVSYLR